jgi:predicted DNA-binding antitoxin AbrB/MazE fold protein
MSIRAIYENGIFKPIEKVPLKEGTEVDVYSRSENGGNGGKPRKSFKNSPAYGIWADRKDIGDSVQYVNRMRQPRSRRSD